jgi:hypothetical protein
LTLALGSVVPAVLAAGWVAAALPLLVLHVYRPVPATILGLGLAVVLGRPAVRAARAAAASFGDVPWWALIGVLVVVVAFGVLTYAHSAEDVLVRRDPGSYAMSATWLSTHGTIQMPLKADVFGAPNPHLVIASQGFYRDGSHIIPQFMSGVPVLLAVGGWLAGVSGILHGNAVISMFALLAFAGLATRLVGARWAPLAVVTLALLQPELDVARATYSEPAAQLILLGGLAIVVDSLVAGRLMPGRLMNGPPNGAFTDGAATPPALTPAHAARGLLVGGLVLGLVLVVRVDAVADLFALVPFLGWLAFHRVREWRSLGLGMLIGLAAGGFDCLVLTLPYAKHVGPDLAQVGGGFAVSVPMTVIGVKVARRIQRRRARSNKAWTPRWTPVFAVALVFLIGLFFAIRPHLMTVRADPKSGGANYVVQVQRFQHMVENPTRNYYENATIWLSWYLGWTALALALLGVGWLVFEQIAGRRRVWAPVFLVCFSTAVAVLFKPTITPDHPWADRRFVPAVLPGLVLFAIAGVVMLVGLPALLPARERARAWARSWRAAHVRPAQVVLGAAAVAALVVPAWMGSADVLYAKTEVGEPGLVRQVCAAFRPGDVVLAVGNRAKTEWPGTLRVMCGIDTAYLDGFDDRTEMIAINAQASANGGRLMLLAEGIADKEANRFDAVWPDQPTAVLATTEATHTLVRRPGAPAAFNSQMWVGQYQRGGA